MNEKNAFAVFELIFSTARNAYGHYASPFLIQHALMLLKSKKEGKASHVRRDGMHSNN